MQHHTVFAPNVRTGRIDVHEIIQPTNQDRRTVSASMANRRASQIVARTSDGHLDPAVALTMLEALAAALDVHVYDAAVDEIETVAVARNLGLHAEPWRAARTRETNVSDGLDSATRRARRYSRRQISRGPARAGVPSDDGTGIRDARATDRTWRGERGGAGDVQPVVALRPVWQVSADGVITPVRRTGRAERAAVTDQAILPTERLAPWVPDAPDARAIRAQRRAAREAAARERAARLEREAMEASSVPLSH